MRATSARRAPRYFPDTICDREAGMPITPDLHTKSTCSMRASISSARVATSSPLGEAAIELGEQDGTESSRRRKNTTNRLGRPGPQPGPAALQPPLGRGDRHGPGRDQVPRRGGRPGRGDPGRGHRPAFAGGSPAQSLLECSGRCARPRRGRAADPGRVRGDPGGDQPRHRSGRRGAERALARVRHQRPAAAGSSASPSRWRTTSTSRAWVRPGGAAAPAPAALSTLSLGTGVGAAIVLDGSVVRGRHNAAGEIGYLVTGRGQLRRSRRRPGGH